MLRRWALRFRRMVRRMISALTESLPVARSVARSRRLRAVTDRSDSGWGMAARFLYGRGAVLLIDVRWTRRRKKKAAKRGLREGEKHFAGR